MPADPSTRFHWPQNPRPVRWRTKAPLIICRRCEFRMNVPVLQSFLQVLGHDNCSHPHTKTCTALLQSRQWNPPVCCHCFHATPRLIRYIPVLHPQKLAPSAPPSWLRGSINGDHFSLSVSFRAYAGIDNGTPYIIIVSLNLTAPILVCTMTTLRGEPTSASRVAIPVNDRDAMVRPSLLQLDHVNISGRRLR